MSFYGNVTNVNNTSFTFDRIYSSRTAMDQNVRNDGIFVGRYVLVDYDAIGDTYYTRLYERNNKFYFSGDYDESTRALYAEDESQIPQEISENLKDYYIIKNQIIWIADTGIDVKKFYKCTGDNDEDGYADFIEIDPPYDANHYLINYNIDLENYPNMGKGYDSTVWQKVYINNAEEYVNIAELNSVVPTFDLAVDAPTIEPRQPHFDNDSNNVYYKLHVQPQWGIKIKDARAQPVTSNGRELPSDENINYYPNDDSKSYPGAIYYNKSGFISSKKNYDESIRDEASLLPTGKSLQPYNTHNPNNPTETKVAEDIQELVLMLPSIGNAISDMWDIVYNDPGNNNDRNKIIEWGNKNGVRMITRNEDGYSFNPDKIETLAGAINSVHDLMGMIIVNDETNSIDADEKTLINSTDANKIYYSNNKFWIKSKSYHFEPVINENGENNSPYREIILADSYSPNQYYLKNSNGDYLISSNKEALEGVIYYTPTFSSKNPDPEYIVNKYYYLDGDGNYLIEDSLSPRNVTYFRDIENEKVTGGEKYFFKPQAHKIINADENKKMGLFYIDGTVEKPCNENTTITFSEIARKNPFIALYTYKDEWSEEQEDIVTIYDFLSSTEITLVEYDENQKYYSIDEDNNYIYLSSLPEDYYAMDNVPYYTIKSKVEINEFYERNKYYYQLPDDILNYYYGSGDYNENYNYFYLNNEILYKDFYEANKYYYKNEDEEYILDINSQKTNNRQYYEYSEKYVSKNSTNPNFKPGSLWNVELDPNNFSNLILDYRYDSWAWKELVGFADTFNTIHGLIIEIRNILMTGDYLTRDQQTVQGCINVINDIIDKIDALKPNHFIAVDEYGRMTSMEPIGDNWISVEINNDDKEAKISHIGPVKPENGIESKSDINTPQFGSKFTIEDWYFDEKGHMHTGETHTVQFPKGSLNEDLTATGSSVLTGISMVPETGAITQSNANVGTLKLTEYENTAETATITANDSLNSAIKNLEDRIIAEENARKTAINDLDATVSKEAGADGLALSVTQVDGEVTTISGSIAANTYDTYGAAESIRGSNTDKEDQNTVYGVKAYAKNYADSLASNYATVKQGETADSAIQNLTILGNKLDKINNNLSIESVKTALGLGSAAYTESSAYATAAQGALADSALQETTKFNYNNSTDTLQNIISNLEDRIKALESAT